MSRRILVAEGNLDMCDFMCEALTDGGYDVQRSHTLPYARMLIEQDRYDLLIAETYLPGGNVGELADRALARGVKQLLLTNDPRQIIELKRKGVSFLCKPFGSSTLLQSIETLFQ